MLVHTALVAAALAVVYKQNNIDQVHFKQKKLRILRWSCHSNFGKISRKNSKLLWETRVFTRSQWSRWTKMTYQCTQSWRTVSAHLRSSQAGKRRRAAHCRGCSGHRRRRCGARRSPGCRRSSARARRGCGPSNSGHSSSGNVDLEEMKWFLIIMN